jgi:pSer/pThr/pTyr-binding forkhead associated (FHA) protein
MGMDITMRQIKKTEKFATNAGLKVPHPTWGTAVLKDSSTVVIHFQGDNTHVNLQPQAEIVLGRADERTHTYPDLDLTPHGAIENGVSRTHAAIRRSEDKLLLFDLGSSNGTFVNGQKVSPESPLILRDGDEIRFGKLVSHIYFE